MQFGQGMYCIVHYILRRLITLKRDCVFGLHRSYDCYTETGMGDPNKVFSTNILLVTDKWLLVCVVLHDWVILKGK